MSMAPSPGRGGQLGIPELSGNAMAEPVQPARMAEVGIGGAGAAQLTLADRINRVVATRQDRADRAAVQDARREGLAAGNETPGTQMEGGGALYRDAFNAAAVEGGSRRLEVQMRERLDALAQEHEGNPAAFQAAAAAYRTGIASTLPGEVRTRFELSFDTLARPYANVLGAQQRQQVAQQAIAAYDEVLPRRLAAIDRLGRQSLRDPAALAALRQEETDALADLARLGPRGAFTFAGREFPADPTRAAAITLPQMVAQQRRIQDAGQLATALGAFAASPRTDAWINEWVARERSPEGSGLAPELLNRIEREMRAELADLNRGRSETQGRAWAELQERVASIDAGLQMTGREVDRITDEEFAAAGRTPEWVASYRRRVAFAGHAFAVRREIGQADDAQLAEMEQRLLPGGDLFRLNPEGALRLADQLGQRRTGDARDRLQQRIADARAEAAAGTGAPPRFATRVPQAWQPAIARAAEAQGLPVALVRELIGLESGGSANAVSRAGAVGPAQIMEATARSPGYGMRPLDPAARTDPDQAIPWAMEYLGRLRAHFGGDMRLALAAYNAGPGRVEESLRPGGRPLPSETLRYIAALLPYAGAPRAAATVTPEEAAAAGLTGAQAARARRELAVAQDQARLRSLGATGTPEEVAAARAALPIEGPDAAENALRFAALEQGLQRRLRAAEQPAEYVAAEFPVVAEQWQRALAEPARTGAAIQATLDAQAQLGIPEAQRQPVPRTVAQQLVAALAAMPTDGERLQTLAQQLAGIPDAGARAQVLASMRGAGLGEGLAIAAAVQERGGRLVAARIATELAQDVNRLGLQPAEKRAIEQTVASVFDSDSRLGGLRRAQYQATGSAEFLRLGEQEQGLLRRVGLVRGAPGASLGSGEARQAYGELFGGREVVNRPRAGVLVTAPVGTDQARLVEGLGAIAQERIGALLPGQQLAGARDMLRRDSVWVDYGSGQFALYGRGRAMPVPGPGGAPIIVTLDQALAAFPPRAAGIPAAAPTPEEQFRRRQQQEMQARGTPRMPFSLPPARTDEGP